jgi:hypothetical protein
MQFDQKSSHEDKRYHAHCSTNDAFEKNQDQMSELPLQGRRVLIPLSSQINIISR